MSLNRKDNFFLFTLIDFLIQVIFISLLCFSVFLTLKPENVVPSEVLQKWKQVGIAKIIDFIDATSKMVPLNRITELTVLIKQYDNFDEFKKALKIIKKLDSRSEDTIIQVDDNKLKIGLENLRVKPSCFLNAQNKPKVIFKIIINEDEFIFINEPDTVFEINTLTNAINFQFNSPLNFTNSEMRILGNKIIDKYKDCLIYVDVDLNFDIDSTQRLLNSYFKFNKINFNYRKK